MLTENGPQAALATSSYLISFEWGISVLIWGYFAGIATSAFLADYYYSIGTIAVRTCIRED